MPITQRTALVPISKPTKCGKTCSFIMEVSIPLKFVLNKLGGYAPKPGTATYGTGDRVRSVCEDESDTSTLFNKLNICLHVRLP